jgi:hypothetical protein
VFAGQDPSPGRRAQNGMSVTELAERWETANRSRQNQRTGDWIGWSPRTAKINRDNFVGYILPVLGDRGPPRR